MSVKRAHFEVLAPRWESFRPSAAAEGDVARGLDLVEPLDGATVVDVGCGTGVVLGPLLRRLGRTGRVLAIDFAQTMLDIARVRHPDPRVTWLCADALEASVPAASIEVLLCFDTLPHFPDLGRVMSVFAHWLAPGGRLLVWHDIGRERLAVIHGQAGAPLSGDLLPPVEELALLATSAGLLVERAEEDETSYTFLARRPLAG
jgi:demethylmenaquinone methyltransferase/2-methoxy-6-polyprenyl-1,4-benzoquinol methylase